MLSAPWSWLLTAVFGITALYCAWHWFRNDHHDPTGRRMVDANHALMSVLMVVMLWRPTGPVGTVVQVIVFAAFTVALGILGWRGATVLERVSDAAHAVMNLAMIWMLAAMPVLMGHVPSAAGAGHDHSGHDHSGHDHSGHGASASAAITTPAWVEGTNLAVIIAMAAVAGWWLLQLARSRGHRLHSGCHLLMAVGMAAMLAAM